MSIYNFETTLEDGTVYSLKKYAGKPIIIVNTATKCGLAPQFKQELDSATEAAEACKTTYGVTFPMHQLIDVNGENTDPLFTYLKNEAPGTVTKAIKWNFTKFLIDRNGKVIERFAPQTSPLKMTAAIESVL
ncbi:TPA: glutathione peroxidase [Enterococcus faecium]